MQSRLDPPSWRERLRELIIGEARSPHDHTIFHKLSLIFCFLHLEFDFNIFLSNNFIHMVISL